MNKLLLLIVVAPAFFVGESGSAQQFVVASRNATVCEMSTQPAAWNHARVRVTGIATYRFEHFTLSEPACGDKEPSTRMWLTFGGRTASGAVYCCPGEGEPRRSKPLVIDGKELPLIEDETFRRFTEQLRKGETTLRVTVVGTFFSGEKDQTDGTWRGFGHMGCCSLLVIEQVERFESAKTAPRGR